MWSPFSSLTRLHTSTNAVPKEPEKYTESRVDSPFLDDYSDRSEDFDSSPGYVSQAKYARSLRITRVMAVFNALLLCGVVYLSVQYLLHAPPKCPEIDCAKATSAYSPILNALPMEYHDVTLNGTLWPPENPAWSRLPPSSETNAIWDKWEPGYSFPLTRADIIAMGKDPETVVRFPDEHFHLGDEAYVGTLDVLHKMHCLNSLRKRAFQDYGDDKPQKHVHGKLWWFHIQHCVDMLAQDLQCHASTEVITYNWRDTQDYPFPDFSLQRKCRDFDAIVAWRDDHRVSMDTWAAAMDKTRLASPGDHYVRGTRQLPYEQGYYLTYGFAGSDLFPGGEGYVAPFRQDLGEFYGETVEPPRVKKEGEMGEEEGHEHEHEHEH